MNTKEKIIDSLIGLMENEDFEDITVKDICLKADVNRSTYYRNFKSKEDIIKNKLLTILDEYIEEYELSNDKNNENYIYVILSTFLKHEKFFKTIYENNQIYILQKALSEYFKDNLAIDNVEELYSRYYHLGGIYNFTICWIENDMDKDIEKLAKIGADITKNMEKLYQ